MAVLTWQTPLRAQAVGAADEPQLIAILQSERSPQEKDAACARLKRIGTEASIPALAALLTNDQLGHSARYALESMPSEKAGTALLDALAKTTGSNQVGIINSLAERGEKRALTPLAKMLAEANPITSTAAAGALGKIGGKEAEQALEAALPQASGAMRQAVDDALLQCATALRDHEAFHKLYESEKSDAVRIAAYRGMIETAGNQALELITQGITSKDTATQTAALQKAHDIKEPGATSKLAGLLPNASMPVQIALIGALDQRGDSAAVPAILVLTAQGGVEVREACINALGDLGGASAVPVLAKFAATGSVSEKKAARAALLDLRNGNVTAAMLQQLPTSSPAEQMELAHALGDRADASAVPELLKLAASGAESIRSASLQAIALLAGSSDLPALIQLVSSAANDDARSAVADAINSVLQRLETKGAKSNFDPIIQAARTGSADVRVALLPSCAGLSSEPARQVLRQSLADADARVSAAAARALADTRDAELLPDLLKLVAGTKEDNLRALAVRGSIRLLTQEETAKFSNAQRVEACKTILAAPLDAAEKRVVLAGLATIKDKAALDLTLALADDPAVQKEALQAAEMETPHQFKKMKLTDQFWSEGANFGDFNHDGVVDVVSGPFWYEGPAFTKRHEYRAAAATFQHPKAGGGVEKIRGFEGALGTNNTYSDNFLTFVYDFNGDGWPDILVIDYPGKAANWFENPKGGDGHWTSHQIASTVDNESPTFLDINGDGKPEIICNANGFFGYYAPTNWSEAGQPWQFHPITPKGKWAKFTHGVGIGDVNGDGRMDLLEKDGWWEQPPSLGDDPVWAFHPFQFATNGAAQMFAYDVNGDGLNDVITCHNPHGYGLVWWEQKRDGTNITFKEHVIIGKDESASRFGVHFSQPHSMALVDVDGDGLLDIVTGKRFWAHGQNGPDPESHDFPAVLYWFQLVRHGNGQVDFVPHLIDDDSGVGTQVVAGNIVNKQFPDIVVGNKKGTFLFVHEVKP